MTADLTPRERVARAMDDTRGWHPSAADQRLTVLDRMTDAALAALADDPGLVEVLAAHTGVGWINYYTRCICACGEAVGDHSAHLADVVRAWIGGRA